MLRRPERCRVKACLRLAPAAAVARRAAGTAASRAAALWTHSAYSAAGSLSATMPAPAWTEARPRGSTTIVRMAMAVSILPEKSM